MDEGGSMPCRPRRDPFLPPVKKSSKSHYFHDWFPLPLPAPIPAAQRGVPDKVSDTHRAREPAGMDEGRERALSPPPKTFPSH